MPEKPRDKKNLFNIAETLSSNLALADLKLAKPSLRKVNLELGSTVSGQFDEKFALLVIKHCTLEIVLIVDFTKYF